MLYNAGYITLLHSSMAIGEDNIIKIYDLRIRNMHLGMRYLLLGRHEEVEVINNLDKKLSLIFKSLMKYDFITRASNGTTLLVGEGNLSFAYSLAQQMSSRQAIIASTYSSYDELSDFGKYNALRLRAIGIKVMHKVDATKLHLLFHKGDFDTIIFQFPNTGSREPIDGHNPNYMLVHDFLISAAQQLKKDGVAIITVVDTDYYNSIFNFEKLAKLIGFCSPVKYAFEPEDFPGYEHTMSHQDGDALEGYEKFATWEFRPCIN